MALLTASRRPIQVQRSDCAALRAAAATGSPRSRSSGLAATCVVLDAERVRAEQRVLIVVERVEHEMIASVSSDPRRGALADDDLRRSESKQITPMYRFVLSNSTRTSVRSLPAHLDRVGLLKVEYGRRGPHLVGDVAVYRGGALPSGSRRRQLNRLRRWRENRRGSRRNGQDDQNDDSRSRILNRRQYSM